MEEASTQPAPFKPIDMPMMSPGQRVTAWVINLGEDEALTRVLDAMVEGQALADFCRDNGFSYTVLRKWIEGDKNRKAAYAQAKEDRADFQAEQILEVSRRDCTTPVLDGEGKLVGTRVDTGKVQQAKLETDNLKWIAARMKPKVYGDKVQVDATMDVRTATPLQLANELEKLGLGIVAHKLLPKAEGDDESAVAS